MEAKLNWSLLLMDLQEHNKLNTRDAHKELEQWSYDVYAPIVGGFVDILPLFEDKGDPITLPLCRW